MKIERAEKAYWSPSQAIFAAINVRLRHNKYQSLNISLIVSLPDAYISTDSVLQKLEKWFESCC